MTKYVSIKEAADMSGKAEITIRRLVRSIVADASSDDRSRIQPDAKEAAKLKKSKKPFSWNIDEELIREKYMSSSKSRSGTQSDSAVLQTLRKQLDTKDKQIESLTEIVQELNERVREGNILMGSLQQHLALPEADTSSSKAVQAEAVKKKSAQKKMAPDAKKAPAKRKGFLAKMFG